MDKEKVLRDFMQRAHSAVSRSRPNGAGSRGYYQVTLPIPGPSSKQFISGHAVADLLIPDVTVSIEERSEMLWVVMPFLATSEVNGEARKHVRTMIGRKALDYTLVADTPEGRLARLLWVFSQGQEKEVSPTTLVIKSPGGDYGVRDGLLVGGAFDGVPMTLTMGDLLVEEKAISTRSAKLTEIRRVLKSRIDQEAFQIFCLLYALAEWDTSIPLDSLLLPKPKRGKRRLSEITTELLNVDEPYRYLYRALVPMFMTYGDFISIFGSNPDRRGNIGAPARIRLINKVSLLPIFE